MGPQPGSTPPIIGLTEAAAAGDISLDPSLVPKAEAAKFYQGSAVDAADAAGNADRDADYIPDGVMEFFRGMRHQEILDGTASMQPGVMHASAQAWKKIADATMFNNMGLNAKVRKSIAAGWEGTAADAVTAATTRFTSQMSEMHNVTQSVMGRIEAAAYGADVVKKQVPPFPPVNPVPTVPGAESPKDAVTAVTASSSEEQAAQWAMVNHYVPTYQSAGQQVPMFVPPTAPDDGGGDNPPGVAGRVPGGTGGPVEGPGTDNQPDPGDHSGTADQNSGDDRQAGTDPASADAASNQTSPAANTQRPTPTTAAGLDPTATTPADVNSSGAGTGPGGMLGYSRTGGPGSARGPGSTGGPTGSGGPGRSVPGVPGTANPVATPGALGRPAAAAGTSALPGMGMPGGRGKGEDDKERKGDPDLLVHERNKIDLIGDPTPAVPPVFGADPHDATPERRKQTESDW